jgi:hypothetical protein
MDEVLRARKHQLGVVVAVPIAGADGPADVVPVEVGHEDGFNVVGVDARRLELGGQLAVAADPVGEGGAGRSATGVDEDRVALGLEQVSGDVDAPAVGAVEDFRVALLKGFEVFGGGGGKDFIEAPREAVDLEVDEGGDGDVADL